MIRSNKKFLLLVLIPIFAETLIFLIIPILGTMGISFMDYNPLGHTNSFAGWDNYRKLLEDENFIIALRNTLVFTIFAVAINIVISLSAATMISQLRSNKTRSFFRMMFFMPCMAPMVASAVVWGRSILNTKVGLINEVVRDMGGTGVAWTGDPDYVMISVIIFTLWADLGYNIILFSAGIDGIPGEVYEAAAIDGAGPVRKFFSVTLPLLGRTTTFVVLMTLISYFQMFAQFSVLLYKDGPQNSGLVLTSYIYKTAFVNKDMGYAAAISVILFLMILIVSLVQRKLGKVEWEY
ncbi:MAG: sugar ABC transporter permease [Firmicutes bacterium]|nr:sugar ABC transporter permease [Bacillota bacterium]MBQ1401531.1 sugar ABC transporter permease [Bacillota bacterium]MBQ2678491.1 sugar ABC transporter permease [Bacillota bacterium]MBR2511604.1 sugar ABC transporter permease [Bacillota bacterium]MDO4860491.1 sugar ABC transporter permease [Bacillota bacterium]